jgi:hypothetical protein
MGAKASSGASKMAAPAAKPKDLNNMGGLGPQPATKGMGSFMTGAVSNLAPNRMRSFM